MPELADKLEEAQDRRLRARGQCNTAAFNIASGNVIDLLAEAEQTATKLGKYTEYERLYSEPGNPIDNIVAWLRRTL
jgi:hypothetical protein